MKSALWHGAAGALFVALAVVWTWPLVSVSGDHLPGAIGDNVQFFWNFWWMRTALASDLDFFRTPYLFAPVGTDLTLHTHTALPAFLGATLLGALPLVTAHNVMLLAALALNGFCAYLLALRLTSDHGASLVAGLAFGGSPYIAAHLNGHFNLTGSAWTIPLCDGPGGMAPGARATRRAVAGGRGPVLDFVPAPFPLGRLDRPLIYETLRLQKEKGSLLELPVGTRDSFQRRGTLDHRVIAYQALHERPLVGGVVSRLSPKVIQAYEADPLIAALLRLSEAPRGHADGPLPPDRERAAQLLERNGVAFVMLNRATAPPTLVAYVEQVLRASERERSLYRVAR